MSGPCPLPPADAAARRPHRAGKSKGSLIDDVGPWKDPAIVAAVEAGARAWRRAAQAWWERALGQCTAPPCAALPSRTALPLLHNPPLPDIARRDAGGGEEGSGVLSGGSMDLERGSGTGGDLTPMSSAAVTPSAAAAAAIAASSQRQLSGTVAAPAGAQASAPLPGSPFDQTTPGTLLQQASPAPT